MSGLRHTIGDAGSARGRIRTTTGTGAVTSTLELVPAPGYEPGALPLGNTCERRGFHAAPSIGRFERPPAACRAAGYPEQHNYPLLVGRLRPNEQHTSHTYKIAWRPPEHRPSSYCEERRACNQLLIFACPVTALSAPVSGAGTGSRFLFHVPKTRS